MLLLNYAKFGLTIKSAQITVFNLNSVRELIFLISYNPYLSVKCKTMS